MIVTMHQPEHLPWLGFFHKMAMADLYVVMDDFQYRHQYFQNRNRIQGVTTPIWLTVPVRKEEHRYRLIKDVRIDNSRNWRKSYWTSISYQYHKAPYYNRYAKDLEVIVLEPWEHLIDFNLVLIDYFREVLNIDTPMVRCSVLDVTGVQSEAIHHACLATDASCYLSGPSGRDYLDESLFAASGIEVRYDHFDHPIYPQAGKKEFTPLLSTLDLIMNCGPESR
ncbi:MAG: WbqC family protein, partial [Candidatus Sericytochromatia bacterium]